MSLGAENFGLATPLALLALPLPLLVALWWRRAAAPPARLRVPAGLIDGAAAETRAGDGGRRRLVLASLAWALLVFALAGPRTVMPTAALPISGREIILVLDFSGSMERRDFVLDGAEVKRIDAVKAVGAEFLRRRAGDRVGLVLFAEEAQLAAVPTFDLAAVERALMEAEIGLIGRSTAIGDGLGLALKRLETSEAPSRTVVLLSDGTATAGAVTAEAAAALASELGITVHTIALGSDAAEEGSEEMKTTRVDTEALGAIAAASGGAAFRVRSTDDLRAVTDAIEGLEAGRTPPAPVAIARELWPWPAAAALVLCLAGFASGRGFRLPGRSIPAGTPARRPASWRPAARSPASGLSAFRRPASGHPAGGRR